MRKALAFVMVFAILALGFPKAQASELSDGLPSEEQLATDLDIQQLQALVDELVQRFRSVDRKALQQAVNANDVATAEALLGFLPGESDALNARMQQLGASLTAKYPGMEAMGFAAIGGPQVEAANRPTLSQCKWLQLSLALAACALSAGPLYFICAYLAICGYCSGGDFDGMCF